MKYLLFLPLLWCSNVLAQPTISLACDIWPGSSSQPVSLAIYNNALYFFAKDTFDQSMNFGDVYSFFKFDGACSKVVDINPGGTDVPGYPANMVELNGKLYMKAYHGTTSTCDLYVYDNNTVSITGNTTSGFVHANIESMIALNGKLYFSARDSVLNNQELWMHDPAINTSMLVADIVPGGSNPRYFCTFNNKLYFVAQTQTTGAELWCYDPATTTATLVSDINPGTSHSGIYGLIVVNNKMYFMAKEPAYGRELYSYDGASAPQRLSDLNPGSGDGFMYGELFYHNNALYFGGDDGITKTQLYKFDLTTNTASLAATIAPGEHTKPDFYVLYGNNIYFTAETDLFGRELWVYDGTSATMISDMVPGSFGSSPSGFTIFNNRLYFSAADTAHGFELRELTDPTLSIQNTSPEEATINIYPNPVYDNATISFNHSSSGDVTITVTNILGQELYRTTEKSTANREQTFTIPLKHLAAGLYYCTLRYDNSLSVYNGTLIKR